jgi:hypothetical protein
VTSFLDAKGAPGVAERTLIRPPSSRLGPIDAAARAARIATSPVAGKYDRLVDRDSAHERLAARAAQAAEDAARAEAETARAAAEEQQFRNARRYQPPERSTTTRRSPREPESMTETMTKVVVKELTGTTGRRIVRGILGSLFKAR